MKIKELRQKNKISQLQIAKYLQMSQTGYSQYETGRTEPDIKTLIAIAKYFHVSVDYLIDYEQPNKLDLTGLSDAKKKCIEDIQKMSDAEAEAISHYFDGMLGREFCNKETMKKEGV